MYISTHYKLSFISPLLEESETHLNHVTHTFLWCLPLSFVSGAWVHLGWHPPLGCGRVSVAILVARGAGVDFLSLKVMAAPLLVVPPTIISAGLSIGPAWSHLLLDEWDSQVEVHHVSQGHCLGAHDDLHTTGVKDIATTVYLSAYLCTHLHLWQQQFFDAWNATQVHFF